MQTFCKTVAPSGKTEIVWFVFTKVLFKTENLKLVRNGSSSSKNAFGDKRTWLYFPLKISNNKPFPSKFVEN